MPWKRALRRKSCNAYSPFNGIIVNEDNELYSYGWVDEKAGTVHIPIDRAMELLVERGLPVRPQPAVGDDANKKDEKK